MLELNCLVILLEDFCYGEFIVLKIRDKSVSLFFYKK